jgi:hypothetical protein
MLAFSFSFGKAIAAVLVLAISLLAGQACAETEACASASPFPNGTVNLPVIKVYTGADGVSHIERSEVKGFTVPFFSRGVLTETVLGPALKVVIVHGPANGTIPVRTGIGRVMFLTLEGSSTVVLPSGEEATALPGEVIIFDDASSKSGHGGRTGPCGYTALSIGIPDGAPDLAVQR